MPTYWCEVLRRAFLASLDAIGEAVGSILFILLVAGIGLYHLWYRRGFTAVTSYIRKGIEVSAIAIIAWFPFFCWSLLRTPYQMHSEGRAINEQGEIKKLSAQLDERQKRRLLSDKLSEFMKHGSVLLDRCIKERGSSEVEQAANAWFSETLTFIEMHMGKSYLERFKDIADQNLFGRPMNYPSDKVLLYHGIRGRVARLHEFIKELQPSVTTQ